MKGTSKCNQAKVSKAASNILSLVAYKYSKEAMEAFFKDTRLFELFKMYAE